MVVVLVAQLRFVFTRACEHGRRGKTVQRAVKPQGAKSAKAESKARTPTGESVTHLSQHTEIIGAWR